MSDDFVDNKAQKFLAEGGVEARRVSHRAQARYLYRLAVGVGGGKADFGFVLADAPGDLESFGE